MIKKTYLGKLLETASAKVAAHQLAKEAPVMERSVYIPDYGKIVVIEEVKEFSEL
jgi:hypothetical protein